MFVMELIIPKLVGYFVNFIQVFSNSQVLLKYKISNNFQKFQGFVIPISCFSGQVGKRAGKVKS
jgi:hypothetical protein